MLKPHIDNLQHSIQWALCDADLGILQLARQRMEQVMGAIADLAAEEQQRAYALVDAMLPMEWPLWMEACRYEDAEAVPATLH